MTRKRWTTDALCALYERAIDDPVGDDPKERRDVAKEVRAVLRAKTLAEATGVLRDYGWGAPEWCATGIRAEAGIDDGGTCPTCGQERNP